MLNKDFNPKIVVFFCNWGYPFLEETSSDIKFVRIMCGGMLTPGLLLNTFEQDADGILLAVCPLEECHYKVGSQRAIEVYNESIRLLEILGLETLRLKLSVTSILKKEQFEKILNQFHTEIKALGPSPIRSSTLCKN